MGKDENLIRKIAYLTDKIEVLDIDSKQTTLTFNVDNEEYDKLFIYFQNRYNRITQKPIRKFEIKIGNVDIVINKNNV